MGDRLVENSVVGEDRASGDSTLVLTVSLLLRLRFRAIYTNPPFSDTCRTNR